MRIKGQKQESLKGQNQHYKKNITDDVYQRSYDRTNKKIHFITRIKDQKQESLKGQNQHYKKNITDDVYNRTTLFFFFLLAPTFYFQRCHLIENNNK